MTNWELFRKLCLIIGGQSQHTLAEVIDRDCFARTTELAAEQGLLPALATRLNEQPGLPQRIPADLNAQLQQALLQNTQRKLQIKAQAIKLTRALNCAGIEPLFLKGTAQLLSNPGIPAGFRKQVDIDILVGHDQVGATCEALKEDGYLFYDFTQEQPQPFADTGKALEISHHHHHLTPMGKPGYSATLEVHKQPLRRRFQKIMPAEQLLRCALSREDHDARFLIPRADFQLLHLVLGDFIHDGYASRFTFPLRAGIDYISMINQASVELKAQVQASCNGKFYTALQVFEELVVNLMGLPQEQRLCAGCNIQLRLKLMEKRLNSPTTAQLLDLQARWHYLALSLWHDAGKLPAYAARKRQNKASQSSAIGNR